MLLRRITKHINDQNWFAVGIDFAIVVIGVFIGLQVANWNEARGERAEEGAFRERIQNDVELARMRLGEFSEEREARLSAIRRIEDMLFGESDLSTLSEMECTYLAYSHVITFPPADVPSITEAFTGGRIGLVKDPSVVQALIEVEQHEDRMRTALASVSENPVTFHREFPDAISIIRVEAPEGFAHTINRPNYRTEAKCDLSGKKDDTVFLSELAMSTSLNATYVAFLREHDQRLEAVTHALKGEPRKENTP